MLSAYFRDVAHKRTMLELLQDRDSIQHEASSELGRKFHNFDIECVDVLIGKPDTEQAGGKIETLLEQLRLRQLSLEQVETYTKQVTAAQNSAHAQRGPGPGPDANPALELDWCRSRSPRTRPRHNLARARKQAEQVVVTAEAESQQRILAGRGEGARILQEGFSEASVLLRKIQSFSDPRLYALSIVAQGLAKCNQPLVPERVFISGGGGGAGSPSDGADERRRRSRATASSGCCSTCSWPRNPASSSSISPATLTCATSPRRSPSRRWRRSRPPWKAVAPAQPSAGMERPLKCRPRRRRRRS